MVGAARSVNKLITDEKRSLGTSRCGNARASHIEEWAKLCHGRGRPWRQNLRPDKHQFLQYQGGRRKGNRRR
ncbi:hypothetical protein Ancab_036924 [Ancistrocladus abbreviatus]